MAPNPREELHRLVAQLPESMIPAALRAVTELVIQRDPFLAHVAAAKEDDEELNEVGRRMLNGLWQNPRGVRAAMHPR